MINATLSTHWDTGRSAITVKLTIAGRTWSREFTERDLVTEGYSGGFTSAARLWLQAFQIRVDMALIKQQLGPLGLTEEPAAEAKAWEIERRVIVGLFPDAEQELTAAELTHAHELDGARSAGVELRDLTTGEIRV
jgi:hypothetical protein